MSHFQWVCMEVATPFLPFSLGRHWIAVFSFIVPAKARNCLQQLLLHTKKKEGEYNLTSIADLC